MQLSRSSYYIWLRRKPSKSELENAQVVEWIKLLFEAQNGILGYRQMTITINREYNTNYNIKAKRLKKFIDKLNKIKSTIAFVSGIGKR